MKYMRQNLHWISGRSRLIAVLLLVTVWLAIPDLSLPQLAPRVEAQQPSVTLGGLGDYFLGSTLELTATFDNVDPVVTGYGPFIDVYLPTRGVDGAPNPDGLSYVPNSAVYLGASVTTSALVFPSGPTGGICPAGQSAVTHPYAEDIDQAAIQVCGFPGDTLLVFQLPFGSFTPDQPEATVNFQVDLSELADLNVPLQLYARGGFQFGSDPLDNPCCDPSVFIDGTPSTILDNPAGSVTPILLEIEKTSTHPEGETATGPNYPRSYTITLNVAPGQVITNVDVFDYFDDNVVITGVTAPGGSVTSLGGGAPSFPYGPVPADGTANELVVNYPSVTGTANFVVDFFVPLNNAGGSDIVASGSGADSTTENRVYAVGDWTPVDLRDAGGIDNAIAGDATCPSCPPTITTINESIAVQKSVTNLTDGSNSPGDILQYTVEFQLSDFFALDDVEIIDTISDGQRLNSAVTVSFTQHGSSFSNTVNPANLDVREYFTGGSEGPGALPDPDAPTATPGTTVLYVDLSGEVLDEQGLGEILGGCVPAGGTGGPDPDCADFNGGPTTGTLVYNTVILDNFTDDFPSGDQSVDSGDTLDNALTIRAETVLAPANLAPTGTPSQATNDTGAAINIEAGALTKQIYAITDTVSGTTILNPSGTPEIRAGDLITFRLRYTLPSSDFEDVVITDYLPLPVLSAAELTTFNDVIADGSTAPGAGIPAAGTAMYGPTGVTDGNLNFRSVLASNGDTLDNGLFVPTLGGPAANENFKTFTFGNYDDPANRSSVIDVLFSVTVSDDPFADGLFLTNFARVTINGTNNDPDDSDDLIQFQLRTPILLVRKDITAVDNPNATVDPSTGNATNVDAGDLIDFEITIENTGGDAAYDLVLTDVLPPGFVIDPAELNFTIQQGDGTPLSFTSATNNPADFFSTGIQIVDPAEGACQHPAVDPLKSIILIRYRLRVDTSVGAGDVLINTTTLSNYASEDNGENYLGDDPANYPNDDAEAEIGGELPKVIVATSEGHTSDTETGAPDDPRPVTIGEIVRYQLAFRIPEGTTNGLQFEDNLPTGMQYLNDGSTRFAFISSSGSAITSSDANINGAGAGIAGNSIVTPTAVFPASNISGGGSPGAPVTFSFGDVSNIENDTDAEFIVLEFNAIVSNIPANEAGDQRSNTFTIRVNGSDFRTSEPVTVIIQEPNVGIFKGNFFVTSGDAGDTVTFQLVLNNAGDANAYNVRLVDVLPDKLELDDPAEIEIILQGGATGLTNNSDISQVYPNQDVIDITVDVMPPGAQVFLIVSPTVRNEIIPDETFTNSATVSFAGLPNGGTDPNPTGSTIPGAPGDPDGARDDSDDGSLPNKYFAEDSNNIFTMDRPTIVKTLETTGDPNTASDQYGAGREDLAIGETVTYLLTVTYPEGTTPDSETLDDGESDNEDLEIIGAEVVAIGANLSGFNYSIGDTDLTSAFITLSDDNGDGIIDRATFDNGDILNTPDGVDDTNDQLVLQITARVDDNPSNEDGDEITNRGRNRWTNVNGDIIGTSDPLDSDIVEPALTLDKSVTAASNPEAVITNGDVTGVDIGDTITFTLTLENTGTGPAYDIRITDTLPNSGGVDFLAFDAFDAAQSTCDARTGWTITEGTPVTTFAFDDLLVGESCEIVFTATITSSVLGDETYTNTAQITEYTSQPGTVDDDRVYDPVEETADITIAQTIPEKTIDGTSEAHTSDGTADTTADPRPVAIGEVITYRLVTTLPEAQTNNLLLVDTLTDNIEYIDGSARISYLADTTVTFSDAAFAGVTNALEPTFTFPASNIDLTGNLLTFQVGDLFNNDDDSGAEFIIVEFAVVVVNSSVNNLGDIWANTYEVFTDNQSDVSTSRGVSEPVYAIVHEPDLTVDKVLTSAANVEGGDTVTYEITITAAGGANNSDAFDINVTDTLDPRLNLVSVTVTSDPGYYVESSRTVNTGPGGDFDITFVELRAGDSVTLAITATVEPTVVIGDTITNTVDIRYTSLPGEQGTNDATPGASGAPDGERNGSGTPAENDYIATDDADIDLTVTGTVSTEKTIAGTTEAHTSEGTADTSADPRPLAIGEVITYRLVSALPQVTSPDVIVTDILTPNIEYITGSARISYLADSVMDFEGDFAGIANELTPTLPIPAGRITFDASRTLIFDVGQVVNNDASDANDELLIIEFDAVVVNTSDNTLGDIWANNFSIDTNNDGTLESTSGEVWATVQEPQLTVDKALVPPAPVDAGDPLNYTITITAAGGPANTDAFDINVLDVLPTTVDLIGVSIDTNPGYVVIDDDSSTLGAGGTVDVTLNELQAGDVVVLLVSGTLNDTVVAGQTVLNTVDVTYTSLPGEQGTNDATPGSSGAPDGERDGSGTPAENDYIATDDESFDVPGGLTLDKLATPSATIGDTVTYALTLTLIEGTTNNVVIVDTLPDNLDFIPGSGLVIFTTPGSSTSITPTFVFADPVLTITLGDVTIPAAAEADTLTITYLARVMDDPVNVDGEIKTNAAAATADGGLSDTAAATTTLTEPVLTIDKSAPVTAGDGGDIVSYTITVAHDATSTNDAYDLVIDDLFADANLNFVNAASGANDPTATITGGTGTATITSGLGAGDTTLRVEVDVLEQGATLEITFDAQIIPGVAAGITVSNTSDLTWDTQDDDGAPEERSYAASDDYQLTTAAPTFDKTVFATSVIDTGTDQGDPALDDVTIGETVTFEIGGEIPEGDNTIIITDTLPDIMTPISAEVISIDAPISSPNLSAGDAEDETDTLNAFINYEDNLNGDGIADTVVFDFGLVSNPPTAGDEFIIVRVTARLLDDAGNADGQTKTNTAEIDFGAGTQSATADFEVVEPVATLEKTFIPDAQVRGGTVEMILVASNLAADGATAPLYDVNVIDILDDWLDVTGVVVDFNAAAAGSTATDNSIITPGYAPGVTDDIDIVIDVLPIDGVATITVTMVIDPDADTTLLPRVITNTAELTGDTLPGEDDVDRDLTDDATDDLNVVIPTLLVTKTDSVDPVIAGGSFQYTITVENSGTPDVDASSVVLTDELPAGITVTLVQPSQGTCQPIVGGVLTCNLGDLASGSSATVTISANVSATLDDGSTLNNVSYVTSQEGNNGNDGNDTPDDGDDARAEEVTDVIRRVDLDLTKSVDDPSPEEGDLVAFTVRVENNGPSQATNVVVTDTIPAGLTFVRFVPTSLPCVYTAPALICTFSELGAGDVRTIGIEATVDAGTSGSTLVNTAVVTTTENETDNTNNSDSASVTVDGADLSIIKTVDNATPSEGDSIIYTLTVTNNGPATATGIEVTDDLSGLPVTYVSDDSASTSTTYDPATGIWTLTGVSLSAGDSLSLNITVTVDAGASTQPQPIVNNAAITASDVTDSNPANDADDAEIAIDGLDLRVQKQVSDATPSAGDTIIYGILLTNLGAGDATNIVVTDDLSGLPVTYVSDNSGTSGTTYDPATGAWSIPALAAGDSLSLNITVTVDAGASVGSYTNIASLTSVDQTDANPDNNVDDAVITLSGLDLALVKTVDNPTPSEGDTIVYTLTITNNGPGNATGVVVNDDLSALPVTYVSDDSASTGTTYDAVSGDWTIGALAAGDSLSLEITVTVNTGTSGSSLPNTASITNVDQPDNDPSNDSDDAVIAVEGLDLALVKTVDIETPSEGDTIVYTLQLTNNGAADATNITVTDDLNALPVTYVSDNSAALLDSASNPTAYNAATGDWTIGALDAGSSLSLEITVTVDAGTSGTDITNTASLTAVDQPDGDPANNDDDAVITVGGVDLALTKVVDNPAPSQGDTITYTITVTNNGPGNATGIQVIESLPIDGVTFTLASATTSQGTFTAAPPVSVWDVGALAAGDSATLELSVTVEIASGAVPNTATISAIDQPDSDPTNNEDQANIALGGTDLAVTKIADNPAPSQGDTVTYTVTASNLGPNDATGVVVVDILPAGLTYVSDDSASTSTTYDPATGDWTIGDLAAGDSLVLNIEVTVEVPAGTIDNDADISGDQDDPNPDNNNDTATIAVGGADLSLTKIVDNLTPNLGDFITYTVTVRNDGPNTAFNVEVTDTLPATVTYSGVFTATQGTFDGSLWVVGTLADGQSESLSITVQVTSLGPTENIAEVTASDQPDPDSTPNNGDPTEDDYDTSGTIFDPPFGRKVFDDSGLPQLEWNIVWVNPGTAAVTAEVIDDVPAGTTYVPNSLECFGNNLTTNVCEYDPLNERIRWQGVIQPDPGATSIEEAQNALNIRFRVTVDDSVNEVFNEAFLTDNGDTRTTGVVRWERVPEGRPVAPDTEIIIDKSAEPSFVTPGDNLTWIINVTNVGQNEAQNVNVRDVLPTGLEILGATANDGSVTVQGQEVIYYIAALAPGQRDTLRIETRVSPDLTAPFILTNVVTLAGDNFPDGEATASAISVDELPATGENPFSGWQGPALLALIVGMGGALLTLWRHLARAAARS